MPRNKVFYDAVKIGHTRRSAIDKDDYLVVTEVLLQNGGDPIDDVWSSIVIKDSDEEYRVCELQLILSHSLHSTSIVGLEKLTHLDLSYSRTTTLPGSIGQLQHLKRLELRHTKKLLTLPDELGNVCSLSILILMESGVKVLPPSMMKLQNLDSMDLSYTKKLLQLPEELGNLSNLRILILNGSSIESLPGSIGQLKNLKTLFLLGANNLSELPEEIGSLTSLTQLILRFSKITSLPLSIGNLSDLSVLDLGYSSIRSWPGCMSRMTGLMRLDIDGIDIPEVRGDSDNFRRILIQTFPALGSLDDLAVKGSTQLKFALACNRARRRTLFHAVSEEGTLRKRQTLCPHMLKNASLAFQNYVGPWYHFSEEYSIEKEAAVYELVRNQFLEVLSDRNNRDA